MTKTTNNDCREMYLVLSQTGSLLSKILKKITKAKYNHSSISLSGDMTNMYSFGRLKLYNAFRGGYVRESINEGMFKRFKDTDAAVFVITISEDTYDGIRERLEEMYRHKDKYRYNTMGLFTAFFGRHLKRKNKYYCSDFVFEVLTDFDIIPPSSFGEIVKPIDFYTHFRDSLIFEGKFCNYSMDAAKTVIADQKRA